MHAQVVQPTGISQVLIPIVVIAIVFAFRMRRMSRSRPLNIGQLWVVPAIYVVICGAAITARPPAALGWLAVIVGIGVGAAIGWYRGKAVQIEVDPETQKLRQKASPLGMVILLGLVVAKVSLNAEGRTAHLDWLGNGLLGVALGTLSAMRIEMYLRAKQVVAAAHARVFG